jgi:hypothetical protein
MYEDSIPSPKQKILEQNQKGAKGVIGFVNDLTINPYNFYRFWQQSENLSISLFPLVFLSFFLCEFLWLTK